MSGLIGWMRKRAKVKDVLSLHFIGDYLEIKSCFSTALVAKTIRNGIVYPQ